MKATIGIYPDLEDEVYRSIEAVSHSDLRRWASGEPEMGDTRRLKSRRAFHAALYNPKYAAAHFATMPDEVDLRTPEGKDYLRDFEERTGKTGLKPSERQTIKQMVESLRQDKEAAKLLSAPGETELAVVADLLGNGSGVLSKGLIDKRCRKCLVDVKGTGYLDEAEFINQFYKYGYDSQGAHYVDLMAAHTKEYLPMFFLCCSSRSYSVWITRLTAEQYVTGKRWYQDMLRLHHKYEGPALALKRSLDVA